ncbi:MAG: apolipoprotein N-acyltransferase [Legionellaceae bacterium]|nr:apolipoprotein N-acyltransferase [Legionellaceae bacterium]
MNQTCMPENINTLEVTASLHPSSTWRSTLRAFCSGLLLPLGFAPFHMPGLAILGLALLFLQLRTRTAKQAFTIGFAFALGFFGLGVSWIYASIHSYGHLNFILSALFTLLFVAYLALYTGFMAMMYQRLAKNMPDYTRVLLFSSLWLLSEYLRSTCLGGFPWLLIACGQMDSPLQHLLPVVGILGTGWFTAFASSVLGLVFLKSGSKKRLGFIFFVLLVMSPEALKYTQAYTHWTQANKQPLSVGVIQANLSMRDKWDESLFWNILDYYQEAASKLIKTKQLIVMPESAIPLPSSYVSDFLETLNQEAQKNNSAVLLGIPHPNAPNISNASDTSNKTTYHNALLSLGQADGVYLKQHLVLFGEYLPHWLLKFNAWLGLPAPNMATGQTRQKLMTVNQHPFAALICYELAYPELLRTQLPQAEWIVSISDDGWFGRSFAVYQHLQMAQVLSKQTGRFQIVSNNSGLSSLINTEGAIINKLPAFETRILEGVIHSATGTTPWVRTGDMPFVLFSAFICLIAFGFRLKLAARKKRRYPNQPC